MASARSNIRARPSVKANGQQVYESFAHYDAAAAKFSANPIDLSDEYTPRKSTHASRLRSQAYGSFISVGRNFLPGSFPSKRIHSP